MSDLSLERLMSISDNEFFTIFHEYSFSEKKRIEKGLEIELCRLGYAKTGVKQELEKWDESNRQAHLKSLLELEALFTRMQIRASYATYIVRKEAQKLMSMK